MFRRGWTLLVCSLLTACVIDGSFHDDDDDDGIGGGSVTPRPDETGGNEPLCPVGAPGCPCTGAGACDPGLECIASIHTCVVPDACAIGAAGCACTNGGTCDPGFICKEEVCVSDMPCHPEYTGTEGCQCTVGGGCDPGLECFSDFCVLLPQETSSESGVGSSG